MSLQKYADIIKKNQTDHPVEKVSADDFISASASCLLTGLIVPAVGLAIVRAWSWSNYLQTALIITFGLVVIHMIFPKRLKNKLSKTKAYVALLSALAAIVSGCIIATNSMETISAENEKRMDEIAESVSIAESKIADIQKDRELTNNEIAQINEEFEPLSIEYETLSNFNYQSKFAKDAALSGMAGFLISIFTLSSITTVIGNQKKTENEKSEEI